MTSVADFEQKVELVLHNVEYILTVAVSHGDTLCIEVEQKSDGARWRGDFTSRYIEDITQKTGSFKKFSIFVRMLRSSVMQESDSVYVDLLTYADLEALKNRKVRGGQGTAPFRPTSNNKRYLIITYNAEFDRVHYPLPLLFEENPEPDALKATIKRLRDEVEELRSQLRVAQHAQKPPRPTSASGHAGEAEEIRGLKEENERLRTQVREWESEADEPKANGNSSLQDRMGELEEELRHSRREKALLASKLEAKESELARLKPSRGHAEREAETLRRRLQSIEEENSNERSAHKRAMARVTRDNASLTEEVRKAKDLEKKLRVKVRELESEMDILKRRARLAGRDVVPNRSRPPPSGSRGPSPLASRGPSPRQGARNSRGPSPAGRRGASPASSRHSTPPGSRLNSRPNSAPTSYRRFDPTAYVREKAAKGGAFPAAAVRRRASTSEDRSVSPDPLRGPSSGPRYRQATAAAEARQRSNSTEGRHVSKNPPGGKGPPGRGAPGGRNGRGGGVGTPPSTWSEDEQPPGRAASPGRALQDVKNKLAKYASGQAGLTPKPDKGPLPGSSEALGKAALAYEDATAEIADIDTRLHALQNFLRAAKTNGPPR